MVPGSAFRGVVLVVVMVSLVAAAVMVSQPVSACSIIPQYFDQAVGKGPDEAVVTYGGQIMVLDFSEGLNGHMLRSGFFMRLAGGSEGDPVVVSVQEGLDSMCGGERFLEFWDPQEGERLVRVATDQGPLTASFVGVVAGIGGLQEVRFVSWDQPEQAQVFQTGLPDDPFNQLWGYDVGLQGDERVLVAVTQQPAQVHVVDLQDDIETGGRAVFAVQVADEWMWSTPSVAFEPDGSRFVVLFSWDNRDRLALMDTRDPGLFEGLLNAPGGDERDGSRPRPVVAWTDDGWAIAAGPWLRLVAFDGSVHEAVLSDGQNAVQVVMLPGSGTWLAFIEDWDDGHKVVRFYEDSTIGQWVYDDPEDQWIMSPVQEWIRFEESQQTGDPAWPVEVKYLERPVSGELVVDTGEDTGQAADGGARDSPGPVLWFVGVFVLVVLGVRRRSI